ncbi:MAG: hypothetical protein WC827_03745 [Candidatus Paceibacterota bacterium]|jgi:hypothetical protein
METTPLEKQQLLALYKKETGNPIGGTSGEVFQVKNQFKLLDYLEWLEHKLLTLINEEL